MALWVGRIIGVALSFWARIHFWLCVVVVWCVWIATPCRARLAMTEKQKTPQIQTRRRILGFCDDFGGFLKKHRLAPSGVLVFKPRVQGFYSA
ncbi:hypothetical protein NYG90_10075 [Helicobacter sp. XJK30-2]|uniref:Uncharacterized protein n=1 Tax=Helicobacter zhangjianzhongii TaxID=2974574 RepID=A0ACC6FVR2_9HELI|nr:hypothetical protein [Helicobacter sp. XJK30-2]MDL0083005.1 hypothetical protein [Helicobacter sp. XJK30-2]